MTSASDASNCLRLPLLAGPGRPLIMDSSSKDLWADCFPLPEDVSLEPQPLSGRQIAELTDLFRRSRSEAEAQLALF